MLSGLAAGIATAVGCIVAAAGAVKLYELDLTRRSIGRLFRRTLSRPVLTGLSVLLCAIEVVVAAGLVLTPANEVVVAVGTVVCLGFVVVVIRARRVGTSCGCFGSFSLHTSGRAELARAIGLSAALGTSLLAIRSRPVSAPPNARIIGALAVILTLAVGARIGRVGKAGRTKLAGQRGWVRLKPMERRRHLRSVAGHPAVIQVVERMDTPIPWHRAIVRCTPAAHRSIVVTISMGSSSLTILSTGSGEPLVLGLTPAGVFTPLSRPPSATAIVEPPPKPTVANVIKA